MAGLRTEIRRELVPQDRADELHGRSTRRTGPKWYSNEVMCCSPSAVTSNSHEEAGEEGASSGEQTTTDKDEETLQAHYKHLESFRLHKYTFKPSHQVKYRQGKRNRNSGLNTVRRW